MNIYFMECVDVEVSINIIECVDVDICI